MNNRRKEDRREACKFAENNILPTINRAHRDCEMECIELKYRISALESLLAECGVRLLNYLSVCPSSLERGKIRKNIKGIDAILPATEGDKNENY